MADLWQNLLGADDCAGIRTTTRQLKKQGRPFLLLPTQKTTAAVTVGLYPAQTRLARAAKSLLRLFAKAGLPLRTDRVSLLIAPGNEFVKFLGSQSGSPERIPQFGILAGNPAHDTQRFIILLFDQNQRPAAIVKAGISEPAKALVEKEQQFLAKVPPDTKAIPRLRGTFADNHVKAFTMDFADGESPRSHNLQKLSVVLKSWISNSQIALCETPAWQQLESGSWLVPVYPALRQLRERNIRATIQHGDFAPWNIKVSPNGTWTVLDWERGTLNGIPGWDWFHYIIQTSILVEHKSGGEIVNRVEALLQSEAFKTYPKQTGISGIEREMVIAYLIHLIEVIKPAEGLEANRALLTTLSLRWFNDRSTPHPIGNGPASPR
jgi:hypothetical protein